MTEVQANKAEVFYEDEIAAVNKWISSQLIQRSDHKHVLNVGTLINKYYNKLIQCIEDDYYV